MIILGIDPGSRHTGFGVLEVEGRKEMVLDYGAVSLATEDDHTLRLKQIYEAVTEIIARYHPDECAIEMPIYGSNAQSMLKLGRAQAAVMLAAVHREIPVTQYAPTEVKKAVVGNGGAAKEQVWYMLRAQLSLTEDRGLDASDALAIALCHAHRAEPGTPTTHKSWASFVAANPDRVA